MKSTKSLLAAALFLGVASLAQAESPADPAIPRIQAALAPLLGEAPEADKIAAAPVSGLYEVQLGMQVVYVSADGRFLMQGEVLDLNSRENVTKPRENALKARALGKVSEDEMVIFGDKGLKHTITVFTDIDCGFCRKMHEEIKSYNEAGIRVRYMSFPRDGGKGESTVKAESVWCAENRNDALTRAKAGEEIAKKECKNPVRDQLALGEEMGVTGTPAIVLSDGEVLPGYVPAARLAAALDARASEASKPTAAAN